ncbi:Gamma-glutamyltranspeptidase [Rhodovastum atsumiense]|uniref:Gamma-glutamyltransferase n=1 Tax=Rhodovastum atsumiense TaxID=504468 RepID=A0A5M6IPW9_9PROT|nr:gamma-glutamyltransferase [Rhodovastum atsumiense]KAA5609947.1 gamma-glutamyltransferase [Rhodovastum atsumiense]CAH2604569.1 Gamma-glutamyltranspeptidase [Rhodovastum atsumiense]
MPVVDIRSPNLSRSIEFRRKLTRSEGGIVVAQNRLAAHIGTEVLRAGGTAVDAALAASFAIGVLEPWMSGIGGVGAMLVRSPDGAVIAIDAGARSPRGLDPAEFPLVEGRDGDLFGWPNVLEDRNVTGARSVGVPGLVAGLAAAHRRFGRMPWRDLVLPAATIAAEGPIVDHHTMLWIAQEMSRIRRDPACRDRFLPGGLPPSAPAAVSGKVARLPTPALAETLRLLAEAGPDAFYRGDLGRALAEDVRTAGGWLSMEDLAAFTAVVEPAATEPYRGHSLHFVPALNGGVTVAMMMREYAHAFTPTASAPDRASFLAAAEAMAKAWTYRFEKLGDGAERTLPSCTTHLSVVDRDGTCVALTQTLLSAFGSAMVSPRTGILLNNGINWFDPRPGRVNSIAPDKKALANYSPMVMTGPGDDVVAIGGSGGRKILPAVFQALSFIADSDWPLDAAIAAPRIDSSAPPTIVADARLPADVVAALGERWPTVLAERIGHPAHFTNLGAVRRRGGVNEGFVEPYHAWADAVAEGDALFA